MAGGLGDFVGGLQGGMGTMQAIQTRRQQQKLNDYALKELETGEAATADASAQGREAYVAEYGEEGAPAAYEALELQDPYILRFGEYLKGKMGKKKKPAATALPMPGVPAFADGGSIPERKDRSKASAKEVARGTDRTVKAPARKAIETGSKLGRIAGGAAAGAGIMGAAQGLGTPTEEYYERLGWDPAEVGLSFWKDMGARAAGVMGDVGDSIPGVGLLKRKMGLGPQAAAPEAAAPEELPMEEEPYAPEPRTALPTRMVSASARSSGGGGEAAAEPEARQAGDAIDVSTLDLNEEEMPNLNEKDWRDFRKQALRQAVIQGIPHTEAKAAADDAVAKIQMRGFTQYASQAAALLGAGNVNGAKRALKAAYQYFPDGNDVKFAVQNGKLLAIGIDEKTQKPFEGGTKVVSPEYLAGAIQNFSNPQNFLAWTQDWREEAQKDRKYEEVDKPLANAQIQSLNSNADARMVAAEAAEQRALAAGAGGGGGMKQTDIRGSSQMFMQQLEMLGFEDPQAARQLASVMAQVKMAAPNIPEPQIIEKVMEAHEAGTLPQLMQRLQQMGQARPAAAAPAAAPAQRPRQALPPRTAQNSGGGVRTPDNPNVNAAQMAEYDQYAR